MILVEFGTVISILVWEDNAGYPKVLSCFVDEDKKASSTVNCSI